METVMLRGHHLRNLYLIYIENHSAMGYNDKHTKQIENISSKIINSECQITLTDELDSFCSECPIGKDCKRTPSFSSYDQKYIRKCGLNIGETYSAREVLRKLKEIDGSFMFERF